MEAFRKYAIEGEYLEKILIFFGLSGLLFRYYPLMDKWITINGPIWSNVAKINTGYGVLHVASFLLGIAFCFCWYVSPDVGSALKRLAEYAVASARGDKGAKITKHEHQAGE